MHGTQDGCRQKCCWVSLRSSVGVCPRSSWPPVLMGPRSSWPPAREAVKSRSSGVHSIGERRVKGHEDREPGPDGATQNLAGVRCVDKGRVKVLG